MIVHAGFLKAIIINDFCPLARRKKLAKRRESKQKVFTGCQKWIAQIHKKQGDFSELVIIHKQEANCKQLCCEFSLIAKERRKPLKTDKEAHTEHNAGAKWLRLLPSRNFWTAYNNVK